MFVVCGVKWACRGCPPTGCAPNSANKVIYLVGRETGDERRRTGGKRALAKPRMCWPCGDVGSRAITLNNKIFLKCE